MKQLLLIILSVYVSLLYAQESNKTTDSLKLLLLKSHDEQWINIANQICEHHTETDYYYSINIINDAIKLSKNINFKQGLAQSYNSLGDLYFEKDDFKSALKNFQNSADIYKQLNLHKNMTNALQKVSLSLLRIFSYKKSLVMIDSLLYYYYDSISPINKSRLYGQLATVRRHRGDNKGTFTAIDSAICVEKRNNLTSDLAESYNILGILHSEIGNYKKSLQSYNESERIFKNLHDTLGVAYAIYNKAIIYYDWGIYAESLKLLLKASDLFISINEQSELANILSAQGIVYHETGDLKLAKEYYYKSIEIARSFNDKASESVVYHNLGELSFEEKDYDSALYYYDKSLQYDVKHKDDLGAAESKNAIASLYTTMKKYNLAFCYFSEAESTFIKYNYKKGLASLYNELAYTYQITEQDSLSLLYYEKSLNISKKIKDRKLLMDTYKKASENYERLGLHEKSLYHYKKYKEYNDSLFNEKSKSYVDFMSLRLEDQVKNKELIKLENEKKILELESKNKTIYFSATTIILLLLVTFFRWRFLIKKKSENELSNQYKVLLETEEKIKALLNANFDSALLVDNNFKILTSNNNELNGFFDDYRQLKGKEILLFFSKNNQKLLTHYFTLVLNSKQSKEFVLVEKNNTLLNIRISPVIDTNKQISTLAFFIKDITVIEKIKRQQEKMQQKMIQSQKMETIGTLAGGIAHDFNNYLATINGYVNMLLEDSKTEDLSFQYLTKTKKAVKLAQSTVKKLLAFSRSNELILAETSLSKLINDSIDMIKGIKPKNVVLEYPKSVPDHKLTIDSNQITQVIINICSNAFHAIGAKEQGKLEFIYNEVNVIKNKSSIKMIEIQISDNGIGMGNETLNRIFEPFFTTKNVGDGTGLGLSVASGIIKQHNGEINVKSVYNQGSVFSIKLPITNTTKKKN